jgi:hypothetical protein
MSCGHVTQQTNPSNAPRSATNTPRGLPQPLKEYTMHVTIQTYEELQTYINLFTQGTLNVLVLESKPGLGKSQLIKHAFQDIPHCWIEGRLSAPSLYRTLYQYQDYPIIFDDADGLVKDIQALNILKTLCQTDQDKRVSWHTQHSPKDIPTSFGTSSPVCILTNHWSTASAQLQAIADRGVHLVFTPDNPTIHAYASPFVDTEIHRFVGQYLHIIKSLSLRSYAIATQIHEAGAPLHAKKMLIGSWGLDAITTAVLDIEIECQGWADQEKIAKFMAMTGKPAATYIRTSREIAAS